MARPSLESLLARYPDQLSERQKLQVALAMIRAVYRKPLHRVFKHELPVCGAKCRDGHCCRARAAWDADRVAPRNGRCRVHGGLSTGPRTAAGKRRIAASNRRRARQSR
jgi:hypothetical protein